MRAAFVHGIPMFVAVHDVYGLVTMHMHSLFDNSGMKFDVRSLDRWSDTAT